MSIVEDFLAMLNEDSKSKLGWREALSDSYPEDLPAGRHPYNMTRLFHAMFGFPVAERLVLNPSVSDRERRLRLILEEFQELVEAMGFAIELDEGNNELRIVHVEGSRYDPVETADAIGDLNVVVNGTAVEFGIPAPRIDLEIHLSNMTKLGPDGLAIINGVTPGYRHGEEGFRSDAPVGKGLKGPNYIEPNIPMILYRSLTDA